MTSFSRPSRTRCTALFADFVRFISRGALADFADFGGPQTFALPSRASSVITSCPRHPCPLPRSPSHQRQLLLDFRILPRKCPSLSPRSFRSTVSFAVFVCPVPKTAFAVVRIIVCCMFSSFLTGGPRCPVNIHVCHPPQLIRRRNGGGADNVRRGRKS